MPPLSERLRALRKERGLTQEALARRTHIGLKAYGELERGVATDPHYSTLAALAHALGVSIAELVGEEEPTPVPLAVAAGQ
jgi:transcriptional regulator with XRE-family HTH domain